MFNQDPKEEVQRVDLQDEGGGEGGGGGKDEVRGGGGGGEEESEERDREKETGEEIRGVAEAGEKGGGGEAEEEREKSGDDDGVTGKRGGSGGERGGEGQGIEAMGSIGVDFEQKVQACGLDLGPEGEGCRPSGSCWCEEAVVSLLQVDNCSSESDEALQREESQRRSRRRFRRINPRGEREVITTDGQEDSVLTTVGALPVS